MDSRISTGESGPEDVRVFTMRLDGKCAEWIIGSVMDAEPETRNNTVEREPHHGKREIATHPIGLEPK